MQKKTCNGILAGIPFTSSLHALVVLMLVIPFPSPLNACHAGYQTQYAQNVVMWATESQNLKLGNWMPYKLNNNMSFVSNLMASVVLTASFDA